MDKTRPATSDQCNWFHRTVKESLQNHHQGFFQRPDERSPAAFALVRGTLGVMNLIPILVPQVMLGRMILTFFSCCGGHYGRPDSPLDYSAAIPDTDQAFEICHHFNREPDIQRHRNQLT